MKISCEYYSFWPLGECENKGFEPMKWIQRLRSHIGSPTFGK